jgi:hypothetical protein
MTRMELRIMDRTMDRGWFMNTIKRWPPAKQKKRVKENEKTCLPISDWILKAPSWLVTHHELPLHANCVEGHPAHPNCGAIITYASKPTSRKASTFRCNNSNFKICSKNVQERVIQTPKAPNTPCSCTNLEIDSISPGSKSKVKSSVQRAIRTQIVTTYPLLAPYIDEIIPKKEQLDAMKMCCLSFPANLSIRPIMKDCLLTL